MTHENPVTEITITAPWEINTNLALHALKGRVDNDTFESAIEIVTALASDFPNYTVPDTIDWTKPRILIAACRRTKEDGRGNGIFIGPKYFNEEGGQIMHRQITYAGHRLNPPDFELGFMGSDGEFYLPSEALAVVKASGQPFNAERNGSDTELTVDGIY